MPDSDRRPTIIEAGLDFSEFGYFTRPLLPGDLTSTGESTDPGWLTFETAVSRMRSGDFSQTDLLLEQARSTADWDLHEVLVTTIGYVGPTELFKDMRREIEGDPIQNASPRDVAVRTRLSDYCQAFCLWSRLDVLPVLLDHYLRLRRKGVHEIEEWPLMIADILTDDPWSMLAHEPPDDLLEDYLNLVMTTYDALVERLGSDKVHVFEGGLLSARSLAEKMRSPERGSDVEGMIVLRERFEPMTGIDCSEIFTGEGSMALKAAAIAEEFLNSDQVDAYEDGVRYFFGHRVPD